MKRKGKELVHVFVFKGGRKKQKRIGTENNQTKEYDNGIEERTRRTE